MYTVLTLGLVVGAVALTGIQVVGAARDLDDAEELVDVAALAIQEGRIADAESALARAEDLLLSANDAVRTSLALDLGRMLPIVEDNIAALEESIEVATTVIHGGSRILGVSGPLQSEGGTLEVSLSDGTLPLATVAQARSEIDRVVEHLVLKDRDPASRFVAGPIRDVRDAVFEEAERRQSHLGILNRGLGLLEEMAGGNGERRYLIAVSNTAEMRGTGGMILNYGVLEGADGTIDLTAFGRIDEIALAEPVVDDVVPEDYLARWDGFDPLQRWRQANLAADFTVIAPALEVMYERATGVPVNGVIQIDPEGLAALLDGVGPVTVPELGQVDGSNVVDLTMHDAYIRFPGVEERSDVLGDVAEASFTRLVEGEVPSLRTLATRLAEAVDGRHVLMHSTDSSTQRTITAFGADGALPDVEGPDSVALTVQNLSGNKLDYFLDSTVELTGDRPAGEVGEIAATVTLSNDAPAGRTDPRYIYGPGPNPVSPAAGVIRSLVTLYVPIGSSLDEVDGDPTLDPVVTGVEAGRPFVSFTVDVPAGQARSVDLSLRLAPRPPGDYELVTVASPRLRAPTFDVDMDTGSGALRSAVTSDRTWLLRAGEEPTALQAPLYR